MEGRVTGSPLPGTEENASMRKRGFTLIELLVVIAIIAILAAILFPVFARARENARKATCQSNLKQIGLGARMYSQDYDEMVLPSYWYGAWWTTLIAPYTKNTGIYKCPSVTGAYGAAHNHANLGYNSSYSETQIAYPSETIHFCDTGQVTAATAGGPPGTWLETGAAGALYFRTPNNMPYYDTDPYRPFPRHLNMCNCVFVDGHAKALPIDKIIGPPAGDPNCLWDRN